ncbi:hypothetical protein Poli38472_004999 [Pythium oligandrum]|uniref:Uncharacterized protein n=1 Tax=Pythium oligandrum TaxID=41045 RepID=A0A8K1CBU0_PYTOL|nr:hypothetical protein Poli38472_004999 [Pythium oligandrum]|eukprot:TMW59930.1 hypothetical protein Poli38472_004999 [Pythium oligandrum]
MSSRDLIGRPLVPFFDADENVNTDLEVDPTTQSHENLDVDARVWDKELGYFVYPSEEPKPTLSAQRPSIGSTPIAIRRNSGANGSPSTVANGGSSKLLLTPDMLSKSAPDTSAMPRVEATPISDNHNGRSTPRSSSAKRASRQRGTPSKSKNKATKNDSQSSGEDKPNTTNTAVRENKNGSSTPSKKNKNKQKTKEKEKEELSANGKWAWSAFQSSPDPKSLPLPPFVAGGSPGFGASPPPLDPPKIYERLDPPGVTEPAGQPRPPSVPPEVSAMSVEHSMTQDLRRMLNIGGDLVDGIRHGQGAIVFTNGDRYEGGFQQGFRHGHGIFMSERGTRVYDGEWRRSERSGTGKERWATTGDRYEGEYLKDRFHGKGVLVTGSSGSRYEGEFMNGRRHGYGRMEFGQQSASRGLGDKTDTVGAVLSMGMSKRSNATNSTIATRSAVYEGQWRDGRMHGEGKYTRIDGGFYEGTWVDGLAHGIGKEVSMVTGEVYEGNWKKGQRHGEGSVIRNGKRRKGLWENGQRIKWTTAEMPVVIKK